MENKKIKIKDTVNLFFRTGVIKGIDVSELASECNKKINFESQKSLKNGLSLARKFLKHSEGKDRILKLTAIRTFARMNHMNSNHADAEKAYLKARQLLNKDMISKGRIDRALIDVYMYLGDLKKSRRRYSSAIKIFEKLKSENDIAMAKVNFANLLHRQDKHKTAEDLYADASIYFERKGNNLAVARCDYNRANTLVQLFNIPDAEILYTKAAKIYDDAGFDIDATDARYGLAWAHMLQGKFHIALKELSVCERDYRKVKQMRGVSLCELDRAEVYLGLNLHDDAIISARKAEKWFVKRGFRYESSKAAFFRAIIAISLGRKKEATEAITRAESGFSNDKNSGFLGAVKLQMAQLSNSKTERMNLIRKANSYYRKAQLPLWQAICDLELVSNFKSQSESIERLENNPAVKSVPHIYAHWQTLKGDFAAQNNDIPRARKHWKLAAERLDVVRAQLPPLELRSAYSKRNLNPHLRLIESNIKENPERAAAWVERFKTSGLWAPVSEALGNDKQRNKVHKSLAALAEQVAVLSSRIDDSTGERGLTIRSKSRILEVLHRNVRNELAFIENDQKGEVDQIEILSDDIKKLSYKHPIIQFFFNNEDLYAFTHFKGNVNTHYWPNGRSYVGTLMRRWRFQLEKALLISQEETHHNIDHERKLFDNIGEWLWQPLKIPESCEKVLITPDGDLSNLPWNAIRVDGKNLIEKFHLVLSPSIRHHFRACKVISKSNKVTVYVGKNDDLPEVTNELKVFKMSSVDNLKIHDRALREDWPEKDSAKVWHFAGHSVLREDNPFYSYLQMIDGPFFAADFRLRNARINLVTLAACRSGEQVTLPGEESTGLVRSLLEMGARNVIGAHWPVSDKTTALWMSQFYKRYLTGDSIINSFRYALKSVSKKYPSAYHWAAFSVFGAGN